MSQRETVALIAAPFLLILCPFVAHRLLVGAVAPTTGLVAPTETAEPTQALPGGLLPTPTSRRPEPPAHASPAPDAPATAIGAQASPEEPWAPEVGTAAALLGPGHWPTVEPSLENLMRQMRQQDRFALVTDEQFAIAWKRPGLEEAWIANREYLALAKYVLQYEAREETRFNAGLPSVALENELQPVAGLIAALTNPEAAWREINAYSTSFIDSIRLADVPLSERDSAPSKWRALRELKKQAQPHASFIDQTLENL